MHKKEILDYWKMNNFVPSKKMGQNFLLNDAIKQNIVNKSDINKDDNVLEIGPGFGAITDYIVKKTNNVIVVELDKRLAELITHNIPQVKLINDDILKLDLSAVFKTANWEHVKVVANLPYSISSKIILKLLQNPAVDEINILIQKEMAERLLAKVNTKDYNAFTVLVSLQAKISILIKVDRKEFLPQPQVESWFIKLEKLKTGTVEISAIDRFLRICFSAKRKKLENNLSQFYSKEVIRKAFTSLQIDPNTRAENLTPQDFERLYTQLEE